MELLRADLLALVECVCDRLLLKLEEVEVCDVDEVEVEVEEDRVEDEVRRFEDILEEADRDE